MPIFFQQDIDEATRMGIWKIEEEESFFLKKVVAHREITHPHKKLQHLAARYLLQYLFPDFPLELILIADTRKPYLDNEAYHFSISHTGNFAAAIVSKNCRVGIDIELMNEKISRIQHKFVSLAEAQIGLKGYSTVSRSAALMSNNENEELEPMSGQSTADTKFLIQAWSCKEAVYKWYGLGEVDFKEHMELKSISETSKNSYLSILLFKRNGECPLHMHTLFFSDLCLSYIATRITSR